MLRNYRLFCGILILCGIFSVSCTKFSAEVTDNSQKKDTFSKQKEPMVSKEEESDEIIEKKQKETYASIKKLEFHYKETILPFDAEDYYEDGIWETTLDTEGGLIAYGKNDITGWGNLLSWTDGKQTQLQIPSGKNIPKKLKSGYSNITPLRYGNTKGYLLYQRNWKRQTYLCYLLDKKGKIKKQIPLQTYLNQEIKEDCYEIRDIQQTENDKINVFVSGYNETQYRKFNGIVSQWDTFYLLEIDIMNRKLSTTRQYGYWLLGADEKNVYGIDFNQMYDFQNFQYGNCCIENRKTKELIDFSEIPNDAVTAYNDAVSQCFDVKNGVIYLANRTGIYRKREDKKNIWERLMKPEDSTYLNENYTLTDLTVIDDNQFYLMFLLGDDDETATILAQYNKNQVSP